MSETSALLFSIIAATIPTLFYTGLIYWADQYEKEPWWLLISAFLWGAIPSILIAYLFNTIFSVPIYALAGQENGDILAASFIAPPVEESIKGLALLGILFIWRHEIDSPLDGIIYGAMVGMGFAMVENVFYFMDTFVEGGTEAWGINIFMRGVIFGLNHALFTSMTGLGIAVARLSGKTAVRFFAPIAGWVMAVASHAIHNLTVSFNNLICIIAILADWGGVWALIAIMIWALVQEQRWLTQYLREEVALGVLTPSQYQTACSSRTRLSHNLGLLFSQGPGTYRQSVRFFHRCSKLAYYKHHQTRFSDTQSAAKIESLRQEITQFRPSSL
ncbi:MAG: PrsW family intramembrane metalloprotease [Ardenticatenaceae bacterium]|nr:PrsW family intramembrane metalloprotease [Ardenticatenaceae bacterium]